MCCSKESIYDVLRNRTRGKVVIVVVVAVF